MGGCVHASMHACMLATSASLTPRSVPQAPSLCLPSVPLERSPTPGNGSVATRSEQVLLTIKAVPLCAAASTSKHWRPMCP